MATKEIELKKYDIAEPSQMANMASVLKAHIVKHQLFTNIQNKNYVHADGWGFAGGLMGTFPRVVEVKDLSKAGEVKWQAEVEIVNMKNNEVIGRGFAICSNKEAKKKTFDEYAILSQAQTRAIGKAYRNLIGWVMKLGGMESTPSEEMPAQAPVKPFEAGKGKVSAKALFDQAKKRVEGMTDVSEVIALDESVQKSKLPADFKKKFKELANKRVDALSK